VLKPHDSVLRSPTRQFYSRVFKENGEYPEAYDFRDFFTGNFEKLFESQTGLKNILEAAQIRTKLVALLRRFAWLAARRGDADQGLGQFRLHSKQECKSPSNP
jgi:hypothetical protein